MIITKKSNNSTSDTQNSDEFESYYQELRESCNQEIIADTVTWDYDDSNIYLTIVTADIITAYTIPIEDLTYDIEKDVEYIIDAVEVEEESVDDELSIDDDII